MRYAIDRFVLIDSGLNIHVFIKRFRKTALAIILVYNNVFRTGKDFEDYGRNMIQMFNWIILSIGWVVWDKANCAYVYVCLFGVRIYIKVNKFSITSGRFSGLNQYYSMKIKCLTRLKTPDPW